MKRLIAIATLFSLSLTLLASCAATPPASSDEGYEPPDLNAFFDELVIEHQFGDEYFMEPDEETLAATYPGLEAFTFVQMVARMPMMSAAVNEFVFLECESVDDVPAVAKILAERVTSQAEGGAWYPESMAAWDEAHVLITDQFVGLIASTEYQNLIERAWNRQFGK